MTTCEDLPDIVLLLRIERIHFQQLRETQNVIHRRAQLVTDTREKLTFCMKRFFQFSRALADATLEICVGEAQAFMQLENACCHTHSGNKLIFVEWFADEVIHTRSHCVEVVGFSRAGSEQNNVSEVRTFIKANSSAKFQTIHVRH